MCSVTICEFKVNPVYSYLIPPKPVTISNVGFIYSMFICISIDCFIMLSIHPYHSLIHPTNPLPSPPDHYHGLFVFVLVCCLVCHYSFLFPFFFSFFICFPPCFLFFLAIASLTASVHTSSGPVPTQTQFPWQQIHPELQVTNHTSACCHL